MAQFTSQVRSQPTFDVVFELFPQKTLIQSKPSRKPNRRGDRHMEASLWAEVHAFLEQVEEQYEPALAVIRNHPFVQGVAQGTVPLDILRQFAHAEYWYMRGGVKHFALSIMTAPDLETQRFYHQRLSG